MTTKFVYKEPHDLETIYQRYLSLKDPSPHILSVAGGSCTGKTSIVVEYFVSKLGKEISVIHQDNFQLGEDFSAKNTSPWKWDDPLHFSPGESKKALERLKKGESAEIPIFSLKENRRVDTQIIQPNTYILFDGLYSLRDGLDQYADLSIYIEASFYARFLRRIFRYTYETKTGPAEVPVQLMIHSVYPAHQKFVKQQREKADYVISTSYSFDETLAKFDAHDIQLEPSLGEKVFSYFGEETVEIAVFKRNNDFNLDILYKNKPLQRAKLNTSLFQELSVIDFNST